MLCSLQLQPSILAVELSSVVCLELVHLLPTLNLDQRLPLLEPGLREGLLLQQYHP